MELFKTIRSEDHDSCIRLELLRKDPLAYSDSLSEIQKLKESLKPGTWMFDRSAIVMFKGPVRR